MTRKDPSLLTNQELRIAKMAAAGLRNSEIAGELWISLNTVKTHLRRAFDKLGVDRRAYLGAALERYEREHTDTGADLVAEMEEMVAAIDQVVAWAVNAEGEPF